MPGLQWSTFWEGNRAELFSTYVLSGVAAVAGVPRPVDFGIDLLCTLTRREEKALYAGRSFGVQVKLGAEAEFRYGGLNDRGEWKRYEVEWLYGQGQPFLLCTVNLRERCVKLYSPTRMWWLRWKKGWPGEVVLVPDLELDEAAAQTSGEVYSRRALPAPSHEGAAGDGFRYRVPLGKPIVEISLDHEETDQAKDRTRECLDRWVGLESVNIRHYQMQVPFTQEFLDWVPNQPPVDHCKLRHYFNGTVDQNVREILGAIGPSVESLFCQLRVQGQHAKLALVVPMLNLLSDYQCNIATIAELEAMTDVHNVPAG